MTEENEKALNCLRQLRNLLMDDEKLKSPILDEKFLIRFVRAKKYDAKSAYKAIAKYYLTRKNNKRIAKCLYPSCEPVKFLLKNRVVGKLKYNDPNGCPVILYQNGIWDSRKQNLDELLAATMILYDELLMSSLDAQLNGVVVIFDMGKFTLSQAIEYTPSRVSTLVNIYQGSYPLRLKGGYLVNQLNIIDIVLKPIRSFLSEKLNQRLVLFGKDLEALHKKLPKEILPRNYGGTLTEAEAFDSDFVENIFKRDDYYKKLMEYGYSNAKSSTEQQRG